MNIEEIPRWIMLKHAWVPAWDIAGKATCCTDLGMHYVEQGYPVDLRDEPLTCLTCIAALLKRDFVYAYAPVQS